MHIVIIKVNTEPVLSYLLAQLQRPLPQHLLTRTAGWLASRRTRWFKNMLIGLFSKAYPIKWEEAVGKTRDDYASFNDFFTRALEPGARPLAGTDGLVSPCDGTLSEYGPVNNGHLLQAKGIDYPLHHLLGCTKKESELYNKHNFFTIYLAPKDYHRIHMPQTGTLTRCTHIPGRLFSVSLGTANNLPGLFCRNERVVCWFEDEQKQPFVVVLVGAMMVGSMQTVWHGRFDHRTRRTAQDMPVPVEQVILQRGEELGRFLMGSTVIIITPSNDFATKSHLKAQLEISLGTFLE